MSDPALDEECVVCGQDIPQGELLCDSCAEDDHKDEARDQAIQDLLDEGMEL